MLCSKIVSENCAFYEIVWKNMVVPDRPQIIRRMRFACWVTKALHTHILGIYNIYFIFRTTFSRPQYIVTLYVYCLSCLMLNLVVK